MSNPPKGNGFPLVREIKGVMCVDIRKLGAEPTPADIASVEQLLNKYEFVLFFSNRSNKAMFGQILKKPILTKISPLITALS